MRSLLLLLLLRHRFLIEIQPAQIRNHFRHYGLLLLSATTLSQWVFVLLIFGGQLLRSREAARHGWLSGPQQANVDVAQL